MEMGCLHRWMMPSGATAQEEVMDSDNFGIAPRKNNLLRRLWPRRNMAVAKATVTEEESENEKHGKG